MMKNRKSSRETEFLGEIYLFSLISIVRTQLYQDVSTIAQK